MILVLQVLPMTILFSYAKDKPSVLIQLLSKNHIKANPGKRQILLSTKNPIDASLDKTCIISSSSEKLLGITTDHNLKFDKHVSDLCDKVSEKLNGLCQCVGYMSLKKSRILLKTFVELQFYYCRLIWMLQSRTRNSKRNFFNE